MMTIALPEITEVMLEPSIVLYPVLFYSQPLALCRLLSSALLIIISGAKHCIYHLKPAICIEETAEKTSKYQLHSKHTK